MGAGGGGKAEGEGDLGDDEDDPPGREKRDFAGCGLGGLAVLKVLNVLIVPPQINPNAVPNQLRLPRRGRLAGMPSRRGNLSGVSDTLGIHNAERLGWPGAGA